MSREDKDWNAEWMRLSDRREVAHDAAFWDRRARDFRGGEEGSPYVSGFMGLMRPRPGESVLDVGCGSGALALPLARAGHDVVALDFSAGMLDLLRQMGIEAEVGLLEHASAGRYESPEAALESLRRMVAPADEREERALERYVAEHLVETTADDGRRAWRQEPEITVRWAFLAWDKRGGLPLRG